MLVDQNDETYTLGPYILSFKNQTATMNVEGYNNMADLVWDEITHEYSDKFIYGEINATVKFQDGTEDPNPFIEILDQSGDVINEKFPHFGDETKGENEFYIRYKANKDGKIVDFIKPRIKVSYLTKFMNVWCNAHPSLTVKFSYLQDRAGALSRAIMELAASNEAMKNPTNCGDKDKFRYEFDNDYLSSCLNLTGYTFASPIESRKILDYLKDYLSRMGFVRGSNSRN